jgi:sugar fermentation stimulation protein A
MNFQPLIRGRFLKRDNRFRATVIVEDQITWAHVPNSGRLQELFTPDRPVWLSRASAANRKTDYDLKLVDYGGILVSVDARLPNPLFAEALQKKQLSEFDYPSIKREATYGHSRLDFHLSGPQGSYWVETKSVTLVENGQARFPDAPTSRGRKHLHSLIEAREASDQAAVVFLVQRPDATNFAPHLEADPLFGETLVEAASAGVKIRAYTCQVSLKEISIAGEIPVKLPAPLT